MQIIPSYRNNELLKELKISQALDQLTPQLLLLFKEMIDTISSKPSWKKQPNISAMKNQAMDNLTSKQCWQSFDLNLSMNLYEYFHVVITSAFIRIASSDRKQRLSVSQQIHKAFTNQ